MFIGGTSFGFMNGANQLPVFPFYAADVSSYGKKYETRVMCCFFFHLTAGLFSLKYDRL